MTTITISRTDYVQRADDEGRDFHPYATVHAAAERWCEDRTDRGFITADEAEGAPIVFVTTEPKKAPTLYSAVPEAPVTESDLVDMYWSGDLPFNIEQSPWAPGDKVIWDGRDATVREVSALGAVTVDLPNGVEVMTSAGALTTAPTGTPAPELAALRTFVVTLRGSSQAEATAENLIETLGEVYNAVTVREAR